MRELCPWYVLSVKHQHEQAVRLALEWKGIETLAATYRSRRRWSDRVKELELPLFAGYVFARFPHEERNYAIDTPGVLRMLAFAGSPAVVLDEEIAAIRSALASQLPLRPWPGLRRGDRVRIERGPLRGVEGTLMREQTKGEWQFVIGVEMLQRFVAVEIAAEAIVPSSPFKKVGYA